MVECSACGSEILGRAFECNGCDMIYCSDHRTGEAHDCAVSEPGYHIIDVSSFEKSGGFEGARTDNLRKEDNMTLEKQHAISDPSRWWALPAIVTWSIGYGAVAIAVASLLGTFLESVGVNPQPLWWVIGVPGLILLITCSLSATLSPFAFYWDYSQIRDVYDVIPHGGWYFVLSVIFTPFITAPIYHFFRRSKTGTPKSLPYYLNYAYERYFSD